MALFKRKTEEKKEIVAESSEQSVKKAAPKKKEKTVKKTEVSSVVAPTLAPSSHLGRDLQSVIKRPRITEKATISAEQGVYVFEVDKNATKHTISLAITALYKVNPLKVHLVPIVSKKVSSKKQRGVFGRTGTGKKAYVYLKKGEKIEIV